MDPFVEVTDESNMQVRLLAQDSKWELFLILADLFGGKPAQDTVMCVANDSKSLCQADQTNWRSIVLDSRDTTDAIASGRSLDVCSTKAIRLSFRSRLRRIKAKGSQPKLRIGLVCFDGADTCGYRLCR